MNNFLPMLSEHCKFNDLYWSENYKVSNEVLQFSVLKRGWIISSR